MPLFPVHRPRVGLSISATQACAVQVRRGWGRRMAVRRVMERPLPSGVLVPSAREVNVKDVDGLAQELRELVRPFSASTVGLSLPVSCANIALFPFESLPASDTERRAIVQWRFQHDERVSVEGAVVAYRVFPCADIAGVRVPEGTLSSPITSMVLAAAIKPAILEQYRQVCERAGLFPVSVGLSSIALCELLLPQLAQHRECLVADWLGDTFLCMAFLRGVPVFLRQKVRRQSGQEDTTALRATLQYYDDQYPHSLQEQSGESVPVFLVGDVPEELAEAAQRGVLTEQLAWTSMGGAKSELGWSVQVCRPAIDIRSEASDLATWSGSRMRALASTVMG